MMKIFGVILITLFSLYVLTDDYNSAYAAKSGTYNFCVTHPAFPDCVGWRTEAIDDNYWFCDYVYLENFCKNAPKLGKEIPLRTQDYCCKYIGAPLKKINSDELDQNIQYEKLSGIKEKLGSISPLIIWTDKDHYNFKEKSVVYGKFDFTNLSLGQNIKDVNFAQGGEISEETFTVDIKVNGKYVLRHIPVSSNGWFSAFFFHNNVYNFSTQNNLLEVDYIITQGIIPPEGPKTHATYHFTTGSVAKHEEGFKIWIDNSTLPNKIRYGVNVENSEKFIELSRQNLVITRLTTPEGYVIPIKSVFTVQDLSTEYSKFIEYGRGIYEIQITYGNNTSKTTFEY